MVNFCGDVYGDDNDDCKVDYHGRNDVYYDANGVYYDEDDDKMIILICACKCKKCLFIIFMMLS